MSRNGTLAVFGAGNIGRSFVGQLFARAGWNVAFIDVDPVLVAELNRRKSYPVVIKRRGRVDEVLQVSGVRAVDGRDREAVAALLAEADLAATCVGKAALPKILPALAAGLLERKRRARGCGHGPESRADSGDMAPESRAGARSVPPLDIILAENDREAPETLLRGLVSLLPEGFPIGERLGIVETSIGKMVPLMRVEDMAVDRLCVFAEEYNTLILDKKGFLGPVPEVEGLLPVDCIMAYVDRKLFIHNLGHAAAAYFGYLADPAETMLARALALPGVRDSAEAAMTEAAAALSAEYPQALSPEGLSLHIADLLSRFANEALGDTVHRVGRDLPRKLGRSDRIVGAALLCQKRGLPWRGIARVFSAALRFRSPGESGELFPPDSAFARLLAEKGLDAVFCDVCGLDPADSGDRAVMEGFSG